MFAVLSPFQPSLHVLDLLVLGVDDVSQESWHVQGLIVEALSRFCELQSNSERKTKLEKYPFSVHILSNLNLNQRTNVNKKFPTFPR